MLCIERGRTPVNQQYETVTTPHSTLKFLVNVTLAVECEASETAKVHRLSASRIDLCFIAADVNMQPCV